MDNIAQILQAPAPRNIDAARARFPQRDAMHPSPTDWRDEVLYFLLPDRFSDGQEHTRTRLNRTQIAAQRAAYAQANGLPHWRWDLWKESGERRFQGGTLAGIKAKLMATSRNPRIRRSWTEISTIRAQSTPGPAKLLGSTPRTIRP